MLKFEKFILPLLITSEHFLLMKYVLLLMLLIYFPFIGIAIGCSLFSIFLNILGRSRNNQMYLDLSYSLINSILANKYAWLVLGFIPLLVISLIYSQMLYGVNSSTVDFMLLSLILLFPAFILLCFYKSSFFSKKTNFIVKISLGAGGLLVLLASCFIFASSLGLVLDDGKRQFIKNPVELLFSLNNIPRYLLFIVSSLAISGGYMLFYFFSLDKKGSGFDEEYAEFISYFGIVASLIFTLLQPPLIIWNLFMLPQAALSARVFNFFLFLVFLLMIISCILYFRLLNPEKKSGGYVFVLFIATFLITSVTNQTATGNAIREGTRLLTYKADEFKKEKLEKRKALFEGEAQVSVKKGESIFINRCTQCHSFEKRIVGPPLNIVLQKYQDKESSLKAFIESPSKRNPGYPSMPKLGLREDEIASVAKYVLKKIKDN